MQIEITKYYINKVEEFAEKCLESNVSQYAKRKQFNKNKIYNDIVTGKLGEYGVYLYLKSIGYSKVTKPDLNIYSAGNKSYAADITAYKKGRKAFTLDKEPVFIHNQFNLHIKSQSAESSVRYGYSWILQYGGVGSGNKDDLFKIPTKNDYMVLCSVEGNIVTIFGFYNFIELVKKKLLKDPVLSYLKGVKKALYFRDFEKIYGSEFKELE